MFLRTQSLNAQKFAGKHLQMSFSNNKTFELWNGFMPLRRQIGGTIGNELYSIEVFPPDFFKQFNPGTEFEKWAAVEVKDSSSLPDGIEILESPGGLYAVFLHKGPASEGPKTYNYIFSEWMPTSQYTVDERPHFALMGDKYKSDSVDSEEEIWIPIRV